MPAMMIVPFEPMWSVARGGQIDVGDPAPDNPGEAGTRYHWTIRASVLHENVSQWLTAKERTLFANGARPSACRSSPAS